MLIPLLIATALQIPTAALDSTVSAAAATGFSGVVVAAPLSGPRDAPAAYARAVGTNPRTGRALAVGDTWRWASVTKQLTAALVLRHVAAGRLALDATLATVLPGVALPNADRITVRMLLQHTSGLADPEDGAGDAMPALYRAPLRDDADAVALRTACAAPPRAAPGAGFHYTNCDYFALGALLARLEGRPYAAVVRARLAAPLGRAGLRVLTTAVRPDVGGRDTDGRDEPRFVLATYGAAAAIVGSAQDLLVVDRALAAGTIVPRPWLDTLWRGEPALGYAALGAWSYEAALTGCAAPVRLVERRGAIGGVQVRNVIAPAADRALIVFTNAARTDFGEVWQGRGLLHDLLAAALCRR